MIHLVKKVGRFAPMMMMLAAFLVLMGCETDPAATTYNDEVETASYDVGEPIEDDNLAIIVSSEFGADTLTTEQFGQQFQQIQRQAPQYGLSPDREDQMRRIIVESFVGQHVLEGEAEARGLEADEQMIDMQLAQARGQFETEEQFQEMLEAEGLTEDEVRALIANQMRQQMLQEELAADATEPTAEEIAAYREERAQQVRARHILFMTQNQDDEAVRERAQAVLDSVHAGHDFAELARRHSDDGTAEDGGDLGYFSRDRMVEPFADAAFALPDSGAVTDELVETQFGYHIIQKTGEREADLMAEEQARETIMRERRGVAMERGFEELRSRATVRINPNVVEGVDLEASPELPR